METFQPPVWGLSGHVALGDTGIGPFDSPPIGTYIGRDWTCLINVVIILRKMCSNATHSFLSQSFYRSTKP